MGSTFPRFPIHMAMLSIAVVQAAWATDSSGDLKISAQQAYSQGQWQTAADLYGQLAKQDPSAENLWHLGRADLGLGHDQDAKVALQQALAKDPGSLYGQIYLAMALDRTGDSDGAFSYLEKAVKQGLPPASLQSNPGLAHMRTDKRFGGILALAEKVAHPCQDDPRFRAFDFWTGDWDVYAGGQLVGHNLVTLEMHGCLIHEHWSGGGVGESFNYYDAHAGKWRQNWVDENGGIVWYEGQASANGVMHMEGGYANADGTSGLARVAWTTNPDGTVHHVIERSVDGGKTWSHYFDALYKKTRLSSAK